MQPLIQFDHVSVYAGATPLLQDLSFSLNDSDKAVLRGKSGSGKSSVLKCLLGLYPPTRGTVFFQGERLSPASIQSVRAAIAYIGQEPILGNSTVRDALLLPFRFKAHRTRLPNEVCLIDMLARFHLTADVLDRMCAQVSGGEKQRIALARAMLLGKSVYLLDEVTSALDAESKKAVMAVLDQPQLTILSVAHDPDWVGRCSLVLDLENGRLIREARHGNA